MYNIDKSRRDIYWEKIENKCKNLKEGPFMHSVKTRITAMTICIIVLASISIVMGMVAIRHIENYDADQTLLLLCETGQKDLNYYFQNAEQSIKSVAAFVESDIDWVDDENLQDHMDRVRDAFQKLAYNTSDVLTYYYRIDPEVSQNVKGFWYVNTDGSGFQEHEVSDITDHDMDDASALVWFTTPKMIGEGVWHPPYITDNVDTRVLSYNVPIYHDGQFIGVVGIEIDYSTMAEVVNNITLYDNGYAFLDDDKGNIVYHPRMDVTTMETQLKVPGELLRDDEVIRYSFEGVEKQAVWLPLNNGMRLNVTVPVREINAAWYKWNTEIGIAFAVLLALFVILIMALIRRTTSHLLKPISYEDEKSYQSKQDKNHTAGAGQGSSQQMNTAEYTVEELKAFLKEMSEKYALARVVDPIECRIIDLKDDGRISMNESCYGIWNSEQKCINCSSALACRTGCHQEKAEHFKDNYYFVQSNPVRLKLLNGSVYDAVVELVNVEKESNAAANNREAENVGSRAAHYLAHHDSLTNVLNADAFYELTRGMIKNSTDETWVMITSNIMNFRLVNTLFGDRKGNEVLVKTASMLNEVAESSKGLCGRLSADQFAVFIPKSGYVEEHLSYIASTLAETYNCGIYKFHIHFGVYEIYDPTIPVSVMCGRANSALRTIRDDLTRSVAYFDHTVSQKALFEQSVLGSFDEALSSGQFKMYLQPQVTKDGSVTGAEALARWQKPDGTMVMPGDFIETLETAGMIHRLDSYIWELAAKQLSIWKDTDKHDLTISVNVSAKDFYNIDVVRVMTELVDKYGVDSRMLRLEITETALFRNPDECGAIVSNLRQKGFLVEIDDFGKGNSTLGLLKDIKADVLKIDMSFLHEIRNNVRNRTILQSIISLAYSLGMDVITEGVETEEQLNILMEMGCNYFQGYFFSRPVPVDVFERNCSIA